MPYSNTVEGTDFTSAVGDLNVMIWFSFMQSGEQRQAADGPFVISKAQFETTQPQPFSSARDYSTTPIPGVWFYGISVQEQSGISTDSGWLFRSGPFSADPPTDPINLLLPQESILGASKLTAEAAKSLPIKAGSTTVTGITIGVTGTDLNLTMQGTDTGLPPGDSFTFTGTVKLAPNDSLFTLSQPLLVRLDQASMSFTSGTGQGFTTAFINLFSSFVTNDAMPKISSAITGTLNSAVLSQAASGLSKGQVTALPSGVVISIRKIRSTTASIGTGTEPAIGILASLGSFGIISSKFPPGTSTCFVATAALGPSSPDLAILRSWRDHWLKQRFIGRAFVRLYERYSPRAAKIIARSDFLRGIVRFFIVTPAVKLARRLSRK